MFWRSRGEWSYVRRSPWAVAGSVCWQGLVLGLLWVCFFLLSPIALLVDVFAPRRLISKGWVIGFILMSLSISGLNWLYRSAVINPVNIALGTLSTYSRTYGRLEDLPYGDLISFYALKNGLDPALVAAIIERESEFNPEAVSPRGARGLMQIHPVLWREIEPNYSCDGNHPPPAKGEDCIFNPEANIRAGTQYLSELIAEFKGDAITALAAYNAGLSAARKYSGETGGDGLPPFKETQAYVRRVAETWIDLRQSDSPPELVQSRVLAGSRLFPIIGPLNIGLWGLLLVWVARRLPAK